MNDRGRRWEAGDTACDSLHGDFNTAGIASAFALVVVPRRPSAVQSFWHCLVCLCFAVLTSAASAAGLHVNAHGQFEKDGRAFRGIGVNYYDLFARTLADATATNDFAGLSLLAAKGIPFARFSAGGYWPLDWGLYRTNRAEHFARLDAVVRAADRHGVGLIPSLFWYDATIPDLVSEPRSAWGNPKSKTWNFAHGYLREVVTRYRSSPAIWAWEFGNEYNLPADLPNAAEHRPPIQPALGTPATRSAADDLTHDAIRTALSEFAREVRRLDPHRALFSGNAFPRPTAWHQRAGLGWKRDSEAQFAEMLLGDNPAPLDAVTVRLYDPASDGERLAGAMKVAGRARRPLFVGEFGVPGPDNAANRAAFRAQLEALEKLQVPLAALWVFDFAGQAGQWSVTVTNERRWQLDEIAEMNRRWKSK